MKCPTCHKDTVYEGNPFRPFCSERCKRIDLGRWAGGEYRVPVDEKQKPSEEDHRPNGEPEDSN
jgi:hypothetical protein